MARISTTSFAAVIRAYLGSPKFAKLASETRESYRRYLTHAEHPDVLGALPAVAVRPSIIRGFIEGYEGRTGSQINALVALKSLEKWAIPRELLAFPITTGVEVTRSDSGHMPWSDTQVAAGEHYAKPVFSRLITLAANTGQRGSDLYRMGWNDIEKVDGRPGINVTQRKTGLKIWIPMTQPLIAAIETWERRPAPFLSRPGGGAWPSRDAMTTAWARERDGNPHLRIICAGMVLHGLRATACIRLRRAGATPQQIADLVGLSLPMTERYCRHADQKQNALAAVILLERTANERASEKATIRRGYKSLRN